MQLSKVFVKAVYRGCASGSAYLIHWEGVRVRVGLGTNTNGGIWVVDRNKKKSTKKSSLTIRCFYLS
jgi:hypothetical protein